jgi:hypothetical protein
MVSRTMTRNRRGGRTARSTGRGRSANLRRGRTSNLRRGRARTTRSRSRTSTSRGRTARSRATTRRSRSTRSRTGARGTRIGGRASRTGGRGSRRLPQRGANGRFVRRRVRTASRSRRPARTPRTRRVSRPRLGSSIVREASERSKAGPALVKRRWYRVDGPVDPSLPEGYAYER